MQSGLNIGIGSWISRQYDATSEPALPPTAIPFELNHLSDLETPEDLARATELSLLANRQVAGSGPYETSGPPRYLWEVHQGIIREMITAVSSLTSEQRQELARANEVLYKPDGYTISDRYALYQETRQIHQDLVAQGASAEEVQATYQDWVALGHKSLIENAIATKVALTERTSRLLAQDDISKIDHALMAMGGDVPYAPTLFTPLSAVSTEHWTEAEVDFQALEESIKPGVPRTSWRQFRGTAEGRVRFRFIAVDLIRSWFTPAIYAADDWKMSSGDMVAGGNGLDGALPSYLSRIYMAQILEVRREPKPTPRPQKPPRFAVEPIPAKLRLDTRLVAKKRASLGSMQSRQLKSKNPTRSSARLRPAIVRPRPATHRLSRLEAKPHIKMGKIGRIARIQKLTAIVARNRVNFVEAQLAQPAAAPQPKPSSEPNTYLVGFGRTALPRCPNPNPNYQWP